MILVRGRYHGQKLELEQPLDLPEGTEVDIIVQPADDNAEREDWFRLAVSRLEQEWDNPEDAIYDDWKKLYGVQGG